MPMIDRGLVDFHQLSQALGLGSCLGIEWVAANQRMTSNGARLMGVLLVPSRGHGRATSAQIVGTLKLDTRTWVAFQAIDVLRNRTSLILYILCQGGSRTQVKVILGREGDMDEDVLNLGSSSRTLASRPSVRSSRRSVKRSRTVASRGTSPWRPRSTSRSTASVSITASRAPSNWIDAGCLESQPWLRRRPDVRQPVRRSNGHGGGR